MKYIGMTSKQVLIAAAKLGDIMMQPDSIDQIASGFFADWCSWTAIRSMI